MKATDLMAKTQYINHFKEYTKMEKAMDLMTFEDLTPDLQMLAEVCGIETVKKMLVNFAGINFYVPRISRLETLIEKYMQLNSEKTFNEMAKELNVSAQFLKNLYRRRKVTSPVIKKN
jgi:hypothetical protein